MSERNLTPNSMRFGSFASTCQGTVDGSHMLQGHGACAMVTVVTAVGASRFPLSSTARLISPVAPSVPGLQVKLQLSRPMARCHVVPPSTETSTAPTTPPPLSLAVPMMVTDDSAGRLAPFDGDVMTEAGAT